MKELLKQDSKLRQAQCAESIQGRQRRWYGLAHRALVTNNFVLGECVADDFGGNPKARYQAASFVSTQIKNLQIDIVSHHRALYLVKNRVCPVPCKVIEIELRFEN